MHLYKLRWGIETTFRVQDEVRIRSKSTSILTRYFLYVLEALIYNLWVSLKGMSFAAFDLLLWLELLLEGKVELDGTRIGGGRAKGS